MIIINRFNNINSESNFNILFQFFIQTLKKSDNMFFEKGSIIDIRKFNSKILFISKGILREYSLQENGDEFTNQFIERRTFILFDENPKQSYCESTKYLEVLETTSLYVFDKKKYYHLINDYNLIREVMTRAFFDQINFSYERSKLLLNRSTEDKYISFCNLYPDIEKRIPLSYISSFIGATISSVSRARKKILNDSKSHFYS